jgi:hypothetical protein
MKTLQFRTNIDCPFRLHKAACGLECLRGRFCKFSIDLEEASHLLSIETEALNPIEIIEVMKREGVLCEEINFNN